MGPLSAVSLTVGFFLLGLTTGGWATISAKFLGIVYIVIAVLVFLDAFVFNSGARFTAWRSRQGQTVVAQPPQ